jgi:amidase
LSDDALDLDAVAQSALVRDDRVPAAELVEAAVRRAERVHAELNVFVSTSFDRAVEEARAGTHSGPFRGVPMVLKDALCRSAGDPYYCGMRVLRDAHHTADHDSELTARFRRAGFVVIGRTNTPELAASATTEPLAFGATRNPWDRERSPSGSSGGSAAAVAARVVAVGHGSDMAGSLRAPASACGLVGMKPSRGRTTLAPDSGEHWGPVTHEGVVTRTVRDTAAVLDAVMGPAPGDPYTAPALPRPLLDEFGASPGRLRVGVRLRAPETNAAPSREVEDAVRRVAELLERLGHDVVDDAPRALDETDRGRHAAIVTGAGVAGDLARVSRELGRPIECDDVEAPTWMLAEIGAGASAVRYCEALEFLQGYARRVVQWWADGFDVLVTPTLSGVAPTLGELAPDAAEPRVVLQRIADALRYTAPFNVTGQPAVSLPLAWSATGLPIGVQFVAAPWRDDVLIRLASQLEAAAPWSGRQPARRHGDN